MLHENCVLTPHLGEFQRAFPELTGDSLALARRAAELSGACLVLKSAQTVIAATDGSIVTNTHASPYLAKAGTGDVLAGLITALIAQGMGAFDSSWAAVWIHGEAGLRIGPGLVASDLPYMIPNVLHDLVD